LVSGKGSNLSNMAQQQGIPQQARPWNPNFTYSDRERYFTKLQIISPDSKHIFGDRVS
jgi:hypothetical protein